MARSLRKKKKMRNICRDGKYLVRKGKKHQGGKKLEMEKCLDSEGGEKQKRKYFEKDKV